MRATDTGSAATRHNGEVIPFRKVLVTGASGFLGRHLMPILQERYGKDRVVGVHRSDFDLMDINQAHAMFDQIRPDAVVHLAAYSGGIGANRKYPADFYFINTILTANVFEVAAHQNVKKLVYPMGGCSYPSTSTSPIGEDQMWQGFPQYESMGYSAAKKMGIVASLAYRDQYGLNSTVIIPGNMYGEYDNFRKEESHVVPAMIRRYFEAQLDGVDEVVMWGTGAPKRDFVYAHDVAAVIPWFLEQYDESGPVNISSGTTTTIKELAETIGRLVGFKGRITWDRSKPDGQMVKIFDVAKLNELGLSASSPLEQGLGRTIAWFREHYHSQSDGIRL